MHPLQKRKSLLLHYLNKCLVVLFLHLMSSNPVKPLIIIDTSRVIMHRQRAQCHIHAVQTNVDAELRVNLLP